MRGRLVIILVLALLLAGCRQAAVDQARLVALDSLIAVSPDSAAALLEAYPDDSLRTAGDRAYRALLLTQARYKAYIPATGDSLISMAVEHYADGHDPDKRTRSLLYKGCVMTELGQTDSAMYWFKRAEAAASRDDHATLGYINYRMGRLYQSQNSDVKYCHEKFGLAIQHFRLCNDSSRLLQSFLELGGVYRNVDNDSAAHYFTLAEQLALETKDTLALLNSRSARAYISYLKGDYAAAKGMALSVLLSGFDLPDSVGTAMIAAMSMARLGQADSASMIGKDLSAPADSASQVLYYDMCAQICNARGDNLGFVTNMRQSESIAGDLLSRSLQRKLVDIETQSKLDTALAASRLAKQQSRFVVAISLMLLMLAGIALALWQKRQKLNAAQKKDQINQLFFELGELSRTSRVLNERVQSAEHDLNVMQGLVKKQQQIIERKNKRIIALTNDSADLDNEHQMRKRLSNSLEYIASILFNFILESHELKPTEFLNKFRNGFLNTPKGGKGRFLVCPAHPGQRDTLRCHRQHADQASTIDRERHPDHLHAGFGLFIRDDGNLSPAQEQLHRDFEEPPEEETGH